MKNFTPRQIEAFAKLVDVYPRGLGIEDPDHRAVFDSLVVRKPSMVELLDYEDSPSGDCYRLTDEAAEALREGAPQNAGMN